MAILRATAAIASTSGELADNFVNVWHFEAPSPVTVGTCSTIGTALSGFYIAIGDYFSKCVVDGAATAHEIVLANLTPGAPGSEDDLVSKVIWRTPFAIPSVGSTMSPLPEEVAIAMSFRASLIGFPEEAAGGTIRPASRRRGRVYLGPFAGPQVVDAAGEYCRVSVSASTAMLLAYSNLVGTVNDNADGGVQHVIYSPSNGVGNIVEHAWIDNAFDTVRSRGRKPTARVTTDLVQIPGP